MFSLHRFGKGTAIALTFSAIAAPAASAMTIGGIPTQASARHAVAVHRPVGAAPTPNYLAQAHQLKTGSSRLFYRNESEKQLAAALSPAPTYSRQDKQLVPSSPAPAPVNAVPTTNPSGGIDWTYAGLGAGGGVALLLAIGGGLAASQRRTRRAPAPVTS